MKIPKKIPKKEIKNLCEIIQNADVIMHHTLKRTVFHKRKNSLNSYNLFEAIDYHDYQGYADIRKNDIHLAYKWDDMGKTLAHEALHLRFPDMEEPNVESLTLPFWNETIIRKAAQKKLIKVLDKYKL